MKKRLALILISLAMITSGCTVNRPSIEEATTSGAKQLGKQNIQALLMNHELQMVAWDKSLEAMIQFNSNGKLTASNNVAEKTDGRWTANAENNLCLKFTHWDNNTNRCYKVYKSDDHYLLFRNNMMENRLIPSEEVLASLADTNVGIMGSPPPSNNGTKVYKKRAPKKISQTKKKDSLLSTVTFGLFGTSKKEKPQTTKEIPFKKEYIPEPITHVKQLSAPHQKLIDTGDCPNCDLQNVDLTGENLKGANLAGANLEGANLQEANLKGANLTGTNLESARLTDSILIKADLQGANLADSNLHWADLTHANLKGANLTRCYMVKAIFYKADLTGADFSGAQTQRAIFEKAKGVPDHILNRTTSDDSLK